MVKGFRIVKGIQNNIDVFKFQWSHFDKKTWELSVGICKKLSNPNDVLEYDNFN